MSSERSERSGAFRKSAVIRMAAALALCAAALSGCQAAYKAAGVRVEEPGAVCAVKAAGKIAIRAPERRLPERETLAYRVEWLGVPVGTITARIKGIKKVQGRDAYELEIAARTNDFCSKIYPVNDRYVSYIDVERLHTLRHEVYRREGRYKKDAATDFDQTGHKAYFRNFLDRSEKTIGIPPDVQDPVSMAYFFRTVPLEINEKKEFYVYNNEETYLVCGVADRKDFIRIPGKAAQEAFHIQPYAKLKGEVVKKGRASAYFSCDERRVPLLGVVKAPLFTEIVAYLEKAE